MKDVVKFKLRLFVEGLILTSIALGLIFLFIVTITTSMYEPMTDEVKKILLITLSSTFIVLTSLNVYAVTKIKYKKSYSDLPLDEIFSNEEW